MEKVREGEKDRLKKDAKRMMEKGGVWGGV